MGLETSDLPETPIIGIGIAVRWLRFLESRGVPTLQDYEWLYKIASSPKYFGNNPDHGTRNLLRIANRAVANHSQLWVQFATLERLGLINLDRRRDDNGNA
jgi:hypothetical protein